MRGFWSASASKLGEFDPQNQSNTLYACGKLGMTPPADWMRGFWSASASKLSDFNPQKFGNTVYACGQLGITPPVDWMRCFWSASASKLGEFIPQAFSNTLYACAQLGITPPTDWMRSFWPASAAKLNEFIPQELSNTLYACAQLDAKPPTDWLQLFSDSVQRSFPDANQQNLAIMAFALATLGLWELPAWPLLWEHLLHSMPTDSARWDAETQLHAQQLYQVYTTSAVERPGLLQAPSPEVLAAVRKSWIDGKSDDRSSKLHADVAACLTRMGVVHTNERWCERAERSIAIAIEGAPPIALEVDGPTHYLQDGCPNGSTRLRNRMLEAHDWRVKVVDYRVWRRQSTASNSKREEYLRRLLA
jgi:hypothetical protein